MRYAFIHAQECTHRGTHLCATLASSRRGCDVWRNRPVSARTAEEQRLLPVQQRLHQQILEAYGAIKLWRALNRSRIRGDHHRVARLLKLASLETAPGSRIPQSAGVRATDQ